MVVSRNRKPLLKAGKPQRRPVVARFYRDDQGTNMKLENEVDVGGRID